MQALQALIFDVDGTLADTERDGHRPAFNRAFQEAGLDWDWTVPLYGELLAVTGGKERILHYLRHWQPDFLERPDLTFCGYCRDLARCGRCLERPPGRCLRQALAAPEHRAHLPRHTAG